LRAAGHDVTAVIDVAPGEEDAAIIEMAVREQRIFVTEDRDFGQLVYAFAKPATGVLLLRFPSMARTDLPAAVLRVVADHGEGSMNGSSCSSPGGFVSAELRESDRKVTRSTVRTRRSASA
jgi:predicted nuclease of predicted toxin-antitoxin system